MPTRQITVKRPKYAEPLETKDILNGLDDSISHTDLLVKGPPEVKPVADGQSTVESLEEREKRLDEQEKRIEEMAAKIREDNAKLKAQQENSKSILDSYMMTQ